MNKVNELLEKSSPSLKKSSYKSSKTAACQVSLGTAKRQVDTKKVRDESQEMRSEKSLCIPTNHARSCRLKDFRFSSEQVGKPSDGIGLNPFSLPAHT